MFEEQDERDEDLDAEDAGLDDENSDDESDEDEEGDEDEDDESDDADEDDEDGKKSKSKSKDEDLDKPITKRQLQEILKSNQNQNNAKRRVDSKKGRDNKQPDKTSERLSNIEQQQAKALLLERKREFGYENGLSPKEVDHVFRLTKRPTKKFLELPEVKGALEAIRSHSKVKSNTPSGSGQHFKAAGGKSWGELKPEEKEANFVNRRRAILDSKKNR